MAIAATSTAYAIDAKTGHLRVIGRQPTGGYNPIHLALDATGKFLFVTNYGTDSIAVFPVKTDGTLGPYPTLTTVEGTLGPASHRAEERPAAPQSARSARAASSTCRQGRRQRHHLPPRPQARRRWSTSTRSPPGPAPAPRHIDFHPAARVAYVINELDSTVTTYRQDRKSGKLTPMQSCASTPPDFTGYSTGAEISVDRAGRNVYVSNRGHDSIGVFAIDPAKGTLTPRQWVPTKGGVPRFFCFDPAQRFLYVANQGGHSIVGYRVERDGKLSPASIRVKVPSPACIVFSGASLMSKTYGFETLSIHAGAGPDPATGARALPIYQTTAYAFDDADHAAALFNLQTVGFIYSRLTNPTNAALETRLATLEGGRGCTVTASGHAAQVLALFPLMKPGDEIVASSRLYGGSLQQMRNTYPKFGWKANIVDADTPDNFKRALTDKTKAFFIESLANPGGVISDIEAIARIADDAGVPLIVDNTHGDAVALQADRLRRDPGHPFDHQVPERHRHVDGRRGRRLRQVRLGERRQVPEPRRAGARLSRPQLLRDVRRHGLHLPQPRRRPARSRAEPGADERLAHHARHRDAGPAHGAPLRQCAQGRANSSRSIRRWRG